MFKISFFFLTVCIQFLTKFERRLKENGVGSDMDSIEMELMKACKAAKGKDERFVSIFCSSR